MNPHDKATVVRATLSNDAPNTTMEIEREELYTVVPVPNWFRCRGQNGMIAYVDTRANGAKTKMEITEICAMWARGGSDGGVKALVKLDQRDELEVVQGYRVKIEYWRLDASGNPYIDGV
jgi:hypothetical protein